MLMLNNALGILRFKSIVVLLLCFVAFEDLLSMCLCL